MSRIIHEVGMLDGYDVSSSSGRSGERSIDLGSIMRRNGDGFVVRVSSISSSRLPDGTPFGDTRMGCDVLEQNEVEDGVYLIVTPRQKSISLHDLSNGYRHVEPPFTVRERDGREVRRRHLEIW